MPSLLSRISQAAKYIIYGGTEERAGPAIPLFGYSQGIPALFKPEESLQAYGDNVWLYRSVLTIAMEIARTKFKLQTTNNEGEIKLITEHQAIETLNKPQPSSMGKSMMTSMVMRFITAGHLLLNGESFWLLDKRLKNGGSPTHIHIRMPQYMKVVPDSQGGVVRYYYCVPGQEDEVLRPEDVVHFRIPDLLNPYRGHSPVQSIRYSIDTHKKADIMNTKKLDNYAVPSGVIETTQTIAEQERKKILAEWKQGYAGMNNSGKTAMLPNGLKFNKTQESNQDMQYVEGKNLVRDEILADYGIGLEMMGRTESQTRANAEAAIFVFQKFGVLPYIEMIADTLNNDYLSAFPKTEGMEFSFDDPVPENMEEKRLNAQALWGVGAATPNEIRKWFGKEALDIPGMDTPYLDLGKMPMGEQPPEPDDPLEVANTQ